MRCLVVNGESQGANEPESILHWNAEPASVDENVKVGVGSLVAPEESEVILVLGVCC